MGLNEVGGWQPLAATQRLQVLDVVRGFALLGILLMNIEGFFGPVMLSGTGIDPALAGVDRWADALVYVLVQGKFYVLFSLLFGMGFAVMSQRAGLAGLPFAGLYWRRALALLGFGLVHALLVWSGDILVSYALVSLALLLFRGIHGRWLVALGLGAMLAGAGWVMLAGLMDAAMQRMGDEAASGWQALMAEQAGQVNALIEAQRQAYAHGSFAEATAQRLSDFGFNLANLMVFGPVVLGLFLLGKWFVDSGAIVHPGAHDRLFARLRWLALPLGLMLLSLALQSHTDPTRMDLRAAVVFCMNLAAGLLMALGYMAWVLRGLQGGPSAGLLALLAPAGRMALSNYLLQSLVCTWLSFGYGLGGFGQVSRSWQVLLALGLFALQVLASHAWLRHFRFGPAEWVWRSLTYLRPQPMRVASS